MDYDWQNFLIDSPIVAHVFLDLRVSEGMGPVDANRPACCCLPPAPAFIVAGHYGRAQ